ncbi:hypothetical protein [Rhizobium sp. MHM7A]|uniref:hypothetical protein n=1 Tax=Rhizobium sp. MHM7A TaxID=2583233 RepID=UPI001105A470|nr:hypothetical protein [Rhizobium sp. MHM7A]TLX16130.1 hypothetical protein FFR93_02055 [Rhizobium sp. MHM7A]
MAATLKDITFMLKPERYKRERFGIVAPVPVKRSVVDLSLAKECPPEATFTEILMHCMRPVKRSDQR